MRISIEENDPGYALWRSMLHISSEIKIFLNGDQINHAQTADDEIGYIKYITHLDAFQKPIQAYGDVRIEIPQKVAPTPIKKFCSYCERYEEHENNICNYCKHKGDNK